MFVLGPEIRFYSNGSPVPPEDQKYKFILAQLGVLQVSAPVYAIPQIDEALTQVVHGILRVGGENAMCGLFCLGNN